MFIAAVCVSPLIKLRCPGNKSPFILPYFVYSETFLIEETVPRAGIRSCRFHCTDVQEHRKQDQGWAMSLLVPHKNNLANVTIPYAKKFALCKTQL